MGLDHGLISRPKFTGKELVTWRKNYTVREWFSECLHHFQDNGETLVTREDLETLSADIITVLDEPDRVDEFFVTYPNCNNKAFFDDLRELKTVIDRIIEETDWENQDVYYWEWY